MYLAGDWTRDAFKLDPKKPAAPQIAWNVAGVGYSLAGSSWTSVQRRTSGVAVSAGPQGA